MKMILLMVLFSTPVNPLPHEKHGYAPRVVKDMETCLTRRSTMQRYFQNNRKSEDIKFSVFCVEFQAIGYDEAVAAFQRTIGEEM